MMKSKILVTVLGVAVLAAIGCGGVPPASGSDAEPDMCAMNPIAYGCGLESKQGAIAGGFKTTETVRYLGSYICSNQPFLYDLAADMYTKKDLFTASGTFWETHFNALVWANPGPGRFSLKPRTYLSNIYMVEAMDGPYHVLYNPSPVTNYGLVQAPDLDPNVRPITIPAYGIWIYAPNERPDYPNGAEVVTIDPNYSVAFQSGDGRCPERKQFVTSL